MKQHLLAASALVALAPLAVAMDAPAATLEDAIKHGKFHLDTRYRLEMIEQDGKADDAAASTLRTRFGYTTGNYNGFSALIEAEDVTEIGDDDYNNTINGKTTYPTVADVVGTEINRAWLKYDGFEDTTVKAGRQTIAWGNQRFIGHVKWRQNEQTFDALTFSNTGLDNTKVNYGYISKINRLFGPDSEAGDWQSNSHVFSVSNDALSIGKVTGYGYMLDFEDDVPGKSSNTFGINIKGNFDIADNLKLGYYAEYAQQSDAGDNTTSYDADYLHFAPTMNWNGFKATIGYEKLGSDNGTEAFQTPLATGHLFNGWMDKFLNTPANGLEDTYLAVSYKVKGDTALNGLLLKGQYHSFKADNGGADYGSEWGVYAKMPVKDNYYVEAKYAEYDADTFSADTQKFVLGVGAKF